MQKTRVTFNDMQDTISIAIATYNGARFLREQLDSLYAQTLLPDEVIVCDDRSSDETVDILKEYHKRYGLKYYVNETILGCNHNFIKAFSLCRGDFVCICDQDDIWLPNKIETLYKTIHLLNQSKPIAVSSLRYDIDANGNIIGEVNDELSEGWKATMLTYSRSQGCSMIMNRCLVNEVVELAQTKPQYAYQMYYDELVAYTAVVKGTKINLPDKLMYYRHHDANVIARMHDKLRFAEKVKNLPTFYGFTIDERLIPLCVTSKLFADDIQNKDLKHFLHDVEKMMSYPSSWKKLSCILRMSALSVRQRVEICIRSTLSICLKKLYHYPTI